MILSPPNLKQLFAPDIDRLYEKVNRPYSNVDKDIESGKLKLVESYNATHLYLVYRDKVKLGILNVETKQTTIKYL